MTITTPIRLLVVDDHSIVRQGLEVILGCEPDLSVVGFAADGEAAAGVQPPFCGAIGCCIRTRGSAGAS